MVATAESLQSASSTCPPTGESARPAKRRTTRVSTRRSRLGRRVLWSGLWLFVVLAVQLGVAVAITVIDNSNKAAGWWSTWGSHLREAALFWFVPVSGLSALGFWVAEATVKMHEHEPTPLSIVRFFVSVAAAVAFAVISAVALFDFLRSVNYILTSNSTDSLLESVLYDRRGIYLDAAIIVPPILWMAWRYGGRLDRWASS